MDVPLFMSVYESAKVGFLLSHAAYCRDVLKLRKGQRAVIGNGRVSGCCGTHWTKTQINTMHRWQLANWVVS